MIWWKSILIVIGILFLLTLLMKIFKVSAKIILAIVINGIIGCGVLILLNLIPVISLPINLISSILTGIFGLPFVIIFLIISLI